MIYCDMFGIETNDDNYRNSYNLTKSNVKDIAEQIAIVLNSFPVFFNIQVSSESSQFDISMSKDFLNRGLHQSGLKADDLLIGIVGHKLHGFEYGDKDCVTSQEYYEEKLGVYSELLTILFNEIRKQLHKNMDIRM